MVREVGVHDGDVLAFGQARAGVIERFVETIRAPSARPFDPVKVLHGRCGVDHRRKRRGIWRDHKIFTEAALESQPGHAKARILIREIQVARIVGGFRFPQGTRRSAPYSI